MSPNCVDSWSVNTDDGTSDGNSRELDRSKSGQVINRPDLQNSDAMGAAW